MSDTPRLPERPSLEQLQKQAKDLVNETRASGEAMTLAEAQFSAARKYGFENWAALKHYIEALRPSLEKYETLARELAAAYSAGDMQAIREINWRNGTSFVWEREPEKMQRKLRRWFASAARTVALALEDARELVARANGYDHWRDFASQLGRPQFHFDAEERRLHLRGRYSDRDWDEICSAAGGVTRLQAAGMEDEGVAHLSRLPQLEEVELGSPRGVLTDRGLEVLRALPRLKRVSLGWLPGITDAGIAHLAACEQLESVDLMGTPTGDGAIGVLMGKPELSRLKTGRNVTDAGLALLHGFPAFKIWQGGDVEYGLLSPDAGPNHLLIDGPFTNAGIAGLVGLDGLFGLSFFWHCSGIAGDGLEPLRHLPSLGMLGCEGKLCDDTAMRHIAAMPRLRMLMAQGTVASDAGFEALSASASIEYIWGRECPNLTGRGFAALATMPALRGIAVSCKNVDDAALALLPRFPALRELTPIGVTDDGFRHIGRCEQLERLTCMYCRDTGDAATEHIAGLPNLKSYYAGETRITDRSPEILGRMDSLEKIEFWNCPGLTDAGVAHLARLPKLREIAMDNLSGVSRAVLKLFPPHVRVRMSG